MDDEPASCELINVSFKVAGILFLSQPACMFRERLKCKTLESAGSVRQKVADEDGVWGDCMGTPGW